MNSTFRYFGLVIAVLMMTANVANAANEAMWDGFEQAAAQASADGRVSESERLAFENILSMGRGESTEAAIKSLTEFLKSNRNTAFGVLSREVFAQLIQQRKDKSVVKIGAAGQKSACVMEMRSCSNGALVQRVGQKCEFEPCPIKAQ